ncbi:max dimerization protein 3 isoform X1 [Carassius carassius]|uniref:max dimerization protein 3 isoform X1 n=1 Tax=Carassius carassius TaxID=217509 RepID=UPI0028691359|nr:max dimerization protein 3 isoform X1 [Carassius carassius]
MEVNTCNIQVLLQAAEYLERREREAEHGYASVLPFYSKGVTDKRKKQKSKSHSPGNSRSVHNELEKHRRAQLKHCLEQLKQQVPLSSDSSRNTTLGLLRQAQLHIKKLEWRKTQTNSKLQEQDERAELLKDRLRWEQRELRTRLEKLQGGSERMRNDSLGSTVSSERSDSEREDVEIDVESMVWTLESDGLGLSHAGVDHSYSTSNHTWL